MQSLIHDLVRYIAGLATPGQSVLVGIDGGAGAGKTTFAQLLADRIRPSETPVSVVHTDLIYRPMAERWIGPIDDMPIGYDLDWERLRDQVILPLKAGRTARFQLYDWVADRLNEWVQIGVGGVTIIDGVFTIRNELAHYYDLHLWFSCPREFRVRRLLNRGDTSPAELECWFPIEEPYVAAQAPEKLAHLVIDGGAHVCQPVTETNGSTRCGGRHRAPPDTPRERSVVAEAPE